MLEVHLLLKFTLLAIAKSQIIQWFCISILK